MKIVNVIKSEGSFYFPHWMHPNLCFCWEPFLFVNGFILLLKLTGIIFAFSEDAVVSANKGFFFWAAEIVEVLFPFFQHYIIDYSTSYNICNLTFCYPLIYPKMLVSKPLGHLVSVSLFLNYFSIASSMKCMMIPLPFSIFLDVPINKGLASLYLTLGLTIAIITLILNKWAPEGLLSQLAITNSSNQSTTYNENKSNRKKESTSSIPSTHLPKSIASNKCCLTSTYSTSPKKSLK